jgi:superfamily I DNA/RNA helicase
MLNEKQRLVAFELTGNTIVSASPGTGKTKTLIARAQWKLDSIPKHKALALITYTNAAADEISARLFSENKNVHIGTIHRFCLEYILRPFGWIYGWHKPKVISYSQQKEFINLHPDMFCCDNPIEELNKIKRKLNGEIVEPSDWGCKGSFTQVSDIYLKHLNALEVIDFNEILYRSYKIISENEFIATSLSNVFYEILIDEFQDTNEYQYEIFKIINTKNVCTFFIVGDDKQKIYRFAGAIDDPFTIASVDFNAPIHELVITYRSTSNIVNAFSSLYDNHPCLDNHSNLKNKNIQIFIKETNKNNNNIKIDEFITLLIQDNKIQLSEIAILTNTWRDAFYINQYLRQKYQTVGLGALPHKNTNSSTFNLLRVISRYFFSNTIRNLRVVRRNVELHVLENNLVLSEHELTLTVNSLISGIYTLNLSTFLIDGLYRLKTLFNSIFKFDHTSIDEIIDLINIDESINWTLLKYLETLCGVEGITINTIHQAKGLEYKVVILDSVNEGKIPYQYWDSKTGIRHPLTENNLIDGRAKLYVGISRASFILIVLHNWKPSLFIPIIKTNCK